jgi:hypothetical protein
VAIPAPPSAGPGAVGAPDGQAFNTLDHTSTDFVTSKNGRSGPAVFLFATEDGTIAGWNPNVDKANVLIAVIARPRPPAPPVLATASYVHSS